MRGGSPGMHVLSDREACEVDATGCGFTSHKWAALSQCEGLLYEGRRDPPVLGHRRQEGYRPGWATIWSSLEQVRYDAVELFGSVATEFARADRD